MGSNPITVLLTGCFLPLLVYSPLSSKDRILVAPLLSHKLYTISNQNATPNSSTKYAFDEKDGPLKDVFLSYLQSENLRFVVDQISISTFHSFCRIFKFCIPILPSRFRHFPEKMSSNRFSLLSRKTLGCENRGVSRSGWCLPTPHF